MPLPRETIEAIRSLRQEVRLTAGCLDGRCGAVSQALQDELGLLQRWGHLRLLDGAVCWLHCWNETADGSIVDATADQFEALFPGDILVLEPGDPLAGRYLASPPGRSFDVQECAGGRLELFVDGVATGEWPNDAVGWEQLAGIVLTAMSLWPQPPPVRKFVADQLRCSGHGHSFTKRDLEGAIDVWRWDLRRTHRGGPWLPADLELDARGTLRPRREHPVVRPVSSPQELAEAIALAVRSFPGLHQRTGRGPEYYPARLAEQADLQVVAVVEGRVVGLALASLGADGAAAAVVGEVAIEPDYQRQGLGRALLAEVEARAAARGLRHLALGADQDVASFYLACGWATTLQVTIRGPERRAILESLMAHELHGHRVGRIVEEGPVTRVWLSIDGYDTALAEQISTITACSALVMFTRVLTVA